MMRFYTLFVVVCGVCLQAAAEPRVLFKQPPLHTIAGNLYVQARPPEGTFGLVSWQKNPGTPDGSFVPARWNAGAKTGLVLDGDLSLRQAGMGDREGATVAQVSGTAVGVYLNSDDLSRDGLDVDGHPLPGSGGYKMMVTPEIRFSRKQDIRPFADLRGGLEVSFDLQVPVVDDQKRAGSHSYVNPCLVFVDPKTKLKFSYIVVAFSYGYRIVKETIAFDEPSNSWMLHTYMAPGQQWVTLRPGSAEFSAQPWTGWRRYTYVITTANAQSALNAFKAQRPEIPCSTNPADYVLQSFHLNAEFNFRAARAELGWSMRDASIAQLP